MTAAIDVRPAPSSRGDQSDSRTQDTVIADALNIMLWIGSSLQIDHGVKRANSKRAQNVCTLFKTLIMSGNRKSTSRAHSVQA